MAGAVQDKKLLIVNNFVMYATIMLQSLPLSTRHSIDARSDVKLFRGIFFTFRLLSDPDVSFISFA